MAKQAVFRFYEELNDFLPGDKKKISFPYTFSGKPSVKDAIEAIGVPHVEVELILVNSQSVDFGYALQDDDHVSVYPVFESMDVTEVIRLRDKPLRKTSFILDVHLGKLAKYTRMLGFDTLYQNDLEDAEIIRIALAEHRIILTRDIGLLKVKAVTHGYFIRSQEPKEQLAEVLRHFDLYNSLTPFSRCIRCNGELQHVSKESVIHLLEPLTRKYFDNFYRCSQCGGIFWEGSHFDRIKSFIEQVITNGYHR